MALLKYDIYVGMGGGFGSKPSYVGTYEYNSEEEALTDAYNIAIEEYQRYEGYHGILSWEECKEDLIESYGEDEIDDKDVDLYYYEQIENWVIYKVKLHEDNVSLDK